MLDWDKPLSQQSANVKQIISETRFPTRIDREAIQRAIEGKETPYDRDWNPTTGAALYRQMGRLNPSATSQQFSEAGIPGIKYLDQASRGAGTGSSNYVIFDPSKIDIRKKYGLAGATAGTMGALAAQDAYQSDNERYSP